MLKGYETARTDLEILVRDFNDRADELEADEHATFVEGWGDRGGVPEFGAEE